MTGTPDGARRAREKRAARARVSAPTLSIESQAARVAVVASGVDTLELHTMAPLAAPMLKELEQLKAVAQAAELGDALPMWVCAGHVFEVKRGGNRRGPLWLESPAMALSINPWAPKGLPKASLELRSRALWADLDEAARDADEVLGVLCFPEPPDTQVSRVDVTVDWQGWVPTEDLRAAFVCRARQDADYRKNRKLTGWTWGGGGAVYARCYDKTEEIKGTDKEGWFPEVWRRQCAAAQRRWDEAHDGQEVTEGRPEVVPFDEEAPVWRLEFQVRREAIREFTFGEKADGVLETWEGTRTHLGSIFGTLSEEWLSLRLPRRKDDRHRLDPRWEALRAGVDFGHCAPVRTLERVAREAHFHRTLDQLAGYVARGIAERHALFGAFQEGDLEDSYKALWRDLAQHLKKKRTTMEQKVEELAEPLRAQLAARDAHRSQREREERDTVH